MDATEASANKSRTFGLDLVRAIAIFEVLRLHYFNALAPRESVLNRISTIDGVQLFFTLSGYLIGAILLQLFGRGEQISLAALGGFWKRRWFRTLPLYFLMLGAHVLLASVQQEDFSFDYRYLFFLQFADGRPGILFAESWSLAVEEWFYILFPVALLIFASLLRSRKTVFLLAALLLLSVTVYARVTMTGSFSEGETAVDWHMRQCSLTWSKLDGPVSGILIAWLAFYYPEITSRVRRQPVLLLAISAVSILIADLLLLRLSAATIAEWTWSAIAVTIVTYAPLILAASAYERSASRLAPLVTHVSLVSYSLYLSHRLLLIGLQHSFPPLSALQALLLFPLFLILAVAISTALYRLFEKPLTDLRDVPALSSRMLRLRVLPRTRLSRPFRRV